MCEVFRLLAASGAVAACLAAGAASQAEGAAGAATPAQCAAPGHYDNAEARKFVSNCLLCALVGVHGVATAYHLPDATTNALARALADKTAPPALRQAVRAGCLRGFRIAASKAKTKGHANGKGPPATATTSGGQQSPRTPHQPHEAQGPQPLGPQGPQGQGTQRPQGSQGQGTQGPQGSQGQGTQRPHGSSN
jgi:hypothetical protein